MADAALCLWATLLVEDMRALIRETVLDASAARPDVPSAHADMPTMVFPRLVQSAFQYVRGDARLAEYTDSVLAEKQQRCTCSGHLLARLFADAGFARAEFTVPMIRVMLDERAAREPDRHPRGDLGRARNDQEAPGRMVLARRIDDEVEEEEDASV